MPRLKMQVVVSYLTEVVVEAESEETAELLVINHKEQYLPDPSKISTSVEVFDTTPTDEAPTPVVPSVNQDLIDQVIARIQKDVGFGDVTAIETLLRSLTDRDYGSLYSHNILQSFLSEL